MSDPPPDAASTEPTPPPGVDVVTLAGWMDEHGLGSGPIVDIEALAGGTQNILLRFRRGGDRFVLRRPPLHKRSNSDDTMRREARVLGALSGSAVPHPALIAAEPDDTVLGAAFYLMEPVDGVNPTTGLPPMVAAQAELRRQFGLAMVEAIAELGSIDHRAVGLDDFGRAEGFLERQVPRWAAQLDSYRDLEGYGGPDIPGVDAVGDWLDRNRPAGGPPGVMHGDYHLANVMVGADGTLAAIVDWELSTIGDPLLDLGWLLATWPDDDGALATTSVTPWDGFPSTGELVAHYTAHSARDTSAIAWYGVLACYKLGIILEGTHARACAGRAPVATGDLLHAMTLRLFERAQRMIASA